MNKILIVIVKEMLVSFKFLYELNLLFKVIIIKRDYHGNLSKILLTFVICHSEMIKHRHLLLC